MKRLHRLIMAGTVLSGATLASMAQAEVEGVTNGPRMAPMKLAQAPEPEKKPEGAPGQKPPAKRPPAAPPHAAPPQRAAPPPQRPAQPAQPPMQRAQPPAAQPRTPPPPPAVQSAPQPAPQTTQPAPQRNLQRTPQTTQPAPQPGVQRTPQTTQPAPQPSLQRTPQTTQPAPQNAPGYVRPLTPQQATPPQTTPPAAQGQQQRAPQTTTPPAAQGQQPAHTPQTTTPPAAQGQQPARPAQPATPPAAAAPTPAPAPSGAGVAPNMQTAPLLRSGAPALTQQYARPIPQAAPGAGLVPQSAQGQPLRRMQDLRAERREVVEGNRTIIREPDRTIIRDGNRTFIRHSDADRFRLGARDVRIERRGNDNVTIIDRPGGDRVVTVLDDDGYLRRRSRIMPDGREIVIIDNRAPVVAAAGGYAGFFVDLPPPVIRIPRDRYIVEDTAATPELIYDTLEAPPVDAIERAYSLDEIRYSAPLRDRMPRIDLNTVTFDSGSWDIPPEQMQTLAVIADGLNRAIARNPREVFLIEGHTDATGNDVDNLSLSDRRAESVAIALSEQFNVPAENLVTQGYGEQFLKVPTPGPERANRRVTVRRITPLLAGR